MAFSITAFCTFVGFAVIAYHLVKFFKFFFLTMYRKPFDLIERYGAGSWAVVTGASDGIGKAFAIELARRGFNIVLISRSKDKLEAVETECKQINSKVKTLIITKDFVKAQEAGFFDDINDKLSKLDVSLLINNAGIMGIVPFTQQTEEDINNHININVLTVARLTKMLIKQMLSREKRGGIITVSSFTGRLPFGYFSVYSGTKAFDDFFSRALSYEIPEDKLDIMSLTSSTVATKLIRNLRDTESTEITTEQCVVATLNDLGYHRTTYGHRKHKILGFITEMFPKSAILPIFTNGAKNSAGLDDSAKKTQ